MAKLSNILNNQSYIKAGNFSYIRNRGNHKSLKCKDRIGKFKNKSIAYEDNLVINNPTYGEVNIKFLKHLKKVKPLWIKKSKFYSTFIYRLGK